MFSGNPTPILLPPLTIIQLINENRGWFENTIYKSDIYCVYNFGAVYPVLPKKFGNIGYVLGLPRILMPNKYRLYCLSSDAVIIENK